MRSTVMARGPPSGTSRGVSISTTGRPASSNGHGPTSHRVSVGVVSVLLMPSSSAEFTTCAA
ncbi:Uncharacterised protein [Mycobacteroides abscessus subsp. abscessus]|nr:Uncharacterised protein [Mycobacteroides abscessus subsp. abscessus]